MANTSASGGYLAPTGTPPDDGEALDNLLHDFVAGVSGLADTLVLPRWQPEPPNIPPAATAWAAVGVLQRTTPLFPFVRHDGSTAYPDPDIRGSDRLQQQEQLEVMVSFYDLGAGGLADAYCATFRDGVYIAQNREVLQSKGWAVAYTGDATPAPILLKERWLYRVDLRVTLRRQIDRTYAVLNLESAQGTINSDNPEITTNFVVEE